MSEPIVQNCYAGLNLELRKNIVKEYYVSQKAQDHRLMERTLNNGLTEISGDGQYFTMAKSFFDEEMKNNANVLNSAT